MELNGIKHTSMYLTEEEKVVVDAVRAGGKATITFHNATFEEAIMRTDELQRNVLSKRYVQDLTHGVISFINIAAENEEGTVESNHYVDVDTKKPLTAGKHSQ